MIFHLIKWKNIIYVSQYVLDVLSFAKDTYILVDFHNFFFGLLSFRKFISFWCKATFYSRLIVWYSDYFRYFMTTFTLGREKRGSWCMHTLSNLFFNNSSLLIKLRHLSIQVVEHIKYFFIIWTLACPTFYLFSWSIFFSLKNYIFSHDWIFFFRFPLRQRFLIEEVVVHFKTSSLQL